MNHYDFEQISDRKETEAAKWTQISKEKRSELMPFTVADLEYTLPNEIASPLQDYIASHVFGYELASASYYQAVIDWFDKQHNYKIEQAWISNSPGVLPAIANALKAFTQESDKVMIFTPVYGPFKRIIENLNREVYDVNFNETYNIDLKDIEAGFKLGVKALILCSPHNPLGKVWDLQFLQSLSLLADQYDVIVISDEIHADIVFGEKKHYIYASVNELALSHSIICTAASKTFNLAGFQNSNIIIPNATLRDKYLETAKKDETGMLHTSSIARKATELSYVYGHSWYDGLKDLIKKNYEYIVSYLNEKQSRIKVVPLEGTYLLWLDFRALNLDEKRLVSQLASLNIVLSPGSDFAEQGLGYMRMNIAYPHHIVRQAIEKIATLSV